MGWFLDRIVLNPTRAPLPAEGAERFWIERENQKIECFRWRFPDGASEPTLVVVKFVGAAGRAENSTPHPFDFWTNDSGVVYVANPPGYGNSPGAAQLVSMVDWALTTLDWVRERHPGVPIVLSGISLGSAVAVGVAAQLPKHNVRGIIIRDVPQIAQVIWQRFGWQTGYLPAKFVMRRVPPALDAIGAGDLCQLPAVFVSSQRDRVVPPAVQQMVIDAYAGPKRVVRLAEAGHYDPMQPGEVSSYREALGWLREAIQDPAR